MAQIDRTLAFTALLELCPDFGRLTTEDGEKLVTELAGELASHNPPDRWEFAREWIAELWLSKCSRPCAHGGECSVRVGASGTHGGRHESRGYDGKVLCTFAA